MRVHPEPATFESLTPDRVIDLVEDVLGVRAEPVCRPLTSYINRVYEVELTNGEAVVAKFHRPGRWSVEALEEEQDFVFDLADAEVPVVVPLADADGATLFEEAPDVWCAVMPRRRGRPFEDPDPAGWRELGRTLARMHAAGDLAVPEHRVVWHPEEASQDHLDYLLDHVTGPPDLVDRYEETAAELLDTVAPLFDESDFTRIHGDMHANNLMRRPDTHGLILIDFDDMAFGPPVQDMWMLLPDTPENCPLQLEHLIHGYRQIREFNRETLRWIEPLRAMRFLHFTAWLAMQRHDSGRRGQDDFGSDLWWNQELRALQEQRQRIREVLSS